MIPAITAENLQLFASKATDPEVLLGLAFLVPEKSPVRREISDMAFKARPEYAPFLAVLAVAMDAADEQSIGELIKVDPDNALGHYLRAHQLYQSGKEQESLDAYRKAAAISELRLYGTITTNALFKALDALNLQGRDRLAALSRTATQMNNFCIYLQHLRFDLSEMSRKSDLATRKEISDLLLIFGGHLYATNFSNRQFAEGPVYDALHLKAENAAAEKSLTANGYVAATRAIMFKRAFWPGLQDELDDPLDAAQFLPSRISRAFSMVDPSVRKASCPIELTANVPESDKAAFEKAEQDSVNASAALIEVLLTDPDGIIGAYLKDLPPAQKNEAVSSYTYVEKLMVKRPDVFRAAAANERAMNVLTQAGENDPIRRNVGKLMGVATAIWRYMTDHNQTLPESLEVLYQNGKYLKNPTEAQSLFTGKSYIYAAAGLKLPDKHDERARFILAYDGDEKDGKCQFVTGIGTGGSIPASDFKRMLQRLGK